VFSTPGKGTIFSIYLPAVIGEPEIIKSDQVEFTISKEEGLILVIDDENIMRKVAKEMLEVCGYSVITASNGRNGIEAFEKQQNEIKGILLDMNMPELSGVETYLELKKINPAVKVLFCSGLMVDERYTNLEIQGVKAIIQKPFTLEDLAKNMKQILK
jgi:CheY-like chemotaxis protein